MFNQAKRSETTNNSLPSKIIVALISDDNKMQILFTEKKMATQQNRNNLQQYVLHSTRN